MTTKNIYRTGQTYTVTDDLGTERQGEYIGREEHAGVTFDAFQTTDRIPFQAGFVLVLLPVPPSNAR